MKIDTPKISVIIPVYKVAAYIKRCAGSLLSQTLNSVEFIFVDDDSPDNSIDLLREVMSSFPDRNVKIITHEVNKGLPSARNTGLKEAQGEYIYHCDSDDWVEVDILEKMLAAAEAEKADFVYCDFFLNFAENERAMKNPDFTNSEKMLCQGLLSGNMKYNVWNKLVKKFLYEKGDISFPDGHPMGEDMTMIMLAALSEKTAHVSEPLYHYVKLNPSAYSATFSEKNAIDTKYNADRTIAFLNTVDLPDKDFYLSCFKLSIKLPFLFSLDKRQYKLWKEWYPEADRYIAQNKFLPFRTRIVQKFAAAGQFWLVHLYSISINRIFYGLIYK